MKKVSMGPKKSKKVLICRKMFKKNYIINLNSNFPLYYMNIKLMILASSKKKYFCEKISLENGIKRICQYINAKDKKQKKLDILNNTFKCPIIYKNFEENNIPANTAIIYEIKSGFDIDQLLTQIENRIKLIRDCMF